MTVTREKKTSFFLAVVMFALLIRCKSLDAKERKVLNCAKRSLDSDNLLKALYK